MSTGQSGDGDGDTGQAAVLGPVLGNAAPKRFSLSWGHVWVCTAKKQVWELLLLQVMSTNNVR